MVGSSLNLQAKHWRRTTLALIATFCAQYESKINEQNPKAVENSEIQHPASATGTQPVSPGVSATGIAPLTEDEKRVLIPGNGWQSKPPAAAANRAVLQWSAPANIYPHQPIVAPSRHDTPLIYSGAPHKPAYNVELWNSFYPAQRRPMQVGRAGSFSPSAGGRR
jgi:hypothetical protein